MLLVVAAATVSASYKALIPWGSLLVFFALCFLILFFFFCFSCLESVSLFFAREAKEKGDLSGDVGAYIALRRANETGSCPITFCHISLDFLHSATCQRILGGFCDGEN